MTRTLFSVLLLVLTATASFAAIQISDPRNPHNLSAGALHIDPTAPMSDSVASGGTDQICIFCHTPHSAAPKSTLWSRPDPDGPVGGFPLYAQDLLIKADPVRTGYNTSNLQYPSGASRMCLSCHDGATAIGILLGGKSITMAGDTKITKTEAIINLATSHPISFNYNDDVILNVLDPLKPGQYVLPDGLDGVDTPLDGLGQMQCTTCHDPHKDTRASSGENLPFWRQTTIVYNSLYIDVCNSCHKAAAAPPPPPVHNP